MEPPFIHLKVHSEYSLIDGLVRIPDLVSATQAQSAFAVALTDHVNLFGLVKFFKAATEEGIKPIFGADLLLREEDNSLSTFTALCLNDQGYHHLMELISQAYLEGRYQEHPTVCWEWLEKKSAGLLILSGGFHG